jgi:hypothetical protein
MPEDRLAGPALIDPRSSCCRTSCRERRGNAVSPMSMPQTASGVQFKRNPPQRTRFPLELRSELTSRKTSKMTCNARSLMGATAIGGEQIAVWAGPHMQLLI